MKQLVLEGGGGYGVLILLLIFIFIIIPLVLFIVGISIRKQHKKTSKIILIIVTVYAIIGTGFCTGIF